MNDHIHSLCQILSITLLDCRCSQDERSQSVTLPTPEHHSCDTGEDGMFVEDIVNMNMY